MDRRDDVLVVGAGPAGLTAAVLLAMRGLRVAVVEREAERPGGVVVLTAAAWEVLAEAGVDVAGLKGGAVALAAVELRSGNEAVELPLGEGAVAALARSQLVRELEEAALRAGAVLLPGFRAVRPEWEERRISGVVARDPRGGDRSLVARAVVDASGAAMFVAGALGQVQPRRGPRPVLLSGWLKGSGTMDGHLELWPGPSWVAVGRSDPSPLMVLERGNGPGDGEAWWRGEPSSVRRVPGAGSLARMQAGEGWVAVGSAAGRGAPVSPGALRVSLETAAAAAWEIGLALQRGPHLTAGQVGATVTLARQAAHLESLLARGLEAAAAGDRLSRAAATGFRRRQLTAALLGEWSPGRGRLSRLLYLWWLARGRWNE